jgi:flavin reductase (DIM6/NTAB) family NADH-FMN oxidoreductase RutF
MTMSSLTSLALSPTPLVTFNVATPSRTLDAMAASRAFNVHILTGDADGARLADHFTRGNMVDAFRGLGELGCELVAADSSNAEAAGEPPMIRGSGVMYVLRCCLFNDGDGPPAAARGLLRVRDHVIVVGQVNEILDVTGTPFGTDQFALAYADRRYRQLGNVVSKEAGDS